MFRSLIAVIVALAIAVVGIAKPAYAYSSDSGVMPVNPPIAINGNDSSVSFNDSFVSFNDSFDRFADVDDLVKNPFVDGLVRGMVEATGAAIGGIVVCYALDGIATAFFPPAAVAAAFCPSIGAASGGAKIAVKAL